MHTHFEISDLITDPMVKSAFRRAERDQGGAFAVPAPRRPVLTGGAAVDLEMV
jgi:hypothetical protein